MNVFPDEPDSNGQPPRTLNNRPQRVNASLSVFARNVPPSGTVFSSDMRGEYMDANQFLEAIRMIVRQELAAQESTEIEPGDLGRPY